MKYETPNFVYLEEATTAIQGDPGGPVKVASVSENGVLFMSSTAASYPVEE
jgi:hypothetical protein